MPRPGPGDTGTHRPWPSRPIDRAAAHRWSSGERRTPSTARRSPCIDPSTGDAARRGGEGRPGRRRRRAVAVAHAAFADGRGAWARTNATERGRVLARVADAAPRAGRASSPRPRPATPASRSATPAGRSSAAAGTFEYYAGAANKHFGQVVPVQDAGPRRRAARAGRAVCALIVPWNFPLLIASLEGGARRWRAATRSSSSRRRSRRSPRCCSASCSSRPACPAECVIVLPGPGGVVGDALVSDRRVAKIGFTGETTTGASILHGVGRQHHPRVARARRQVGVRRVRRRRPRARRRRHADVGVRQRRPGLLRPQPHPRRAIGLRRLRRARSSARTEAHHRRRRRSTRRPRWAR